MTIEFGFVGSLILMALLFCGLLLANKITSFGATAASLSVVTVITFIVGLLPSIGGMVGIVVQYFLLKKINPRGPVIFTMLVSIITTLLVVTAFVQLFNDLF